MKSILFILDGYPVHGSNACVFARNLICELADRGIQCCVIAPQIITPNKIKTRIPYHVVDYTENGVKIDVYSPFYLYASSHSVFLNISLGNHVKAVCNVIEKEHLSFDAVYGHFIYMCGLSSAIIGKKYSVPSFLSVGESDKLIPGNKRNHGAYFNGLKKHNWHEILSLHTGVICVSEYTKMLLIKNGFLDQNANIQVFVNGVNTRLFHPTDKGPIRKQLDIPEDAFVISFVGAFNENKGATRVSEAIDSISEEIYSIFIGRDGNCIPTCRRIIFVGQCSNEKVALYLQAADCFVLPTKSEGCCNAILEALACGIPVISSNLPFNIGIINSKNGILVNPNNIREIADAIISLKSDRLLYNKLRKGAIESSECFDIKNRAVGIQRFMEKSIEAR